MQTQVVRSAVWDRVALGIMAGAGAGLVAGLGARVTMRILADAVGQFPILTLEGTLNILLLGLGSGMVLGAIYGGVKPKLPGPMPVHGLLVGLVLFGAVGVQLFTQSVDGERENAALQLAEVLFGLLCFLYGLALALFYQVIERTLRSRLSH